MLRSVLLSAVVLALHGLAMWDEIMEGFTDLTKAADKHNFIVVYPNGTGLVQSWNAGSFSGVSQ